jgi:type VI secretion system protein ImpA
MPMDIALLLAPVTAEAPCGIDLSFSPEWDAIMEMRREDDPTLDQGAWVAALKSADWPGVARSCESLLTGRSKDLRLVGWLTDACARLRGFDGLADGLALSAGLVASYWDRVHPLPDDGDQEQRIGNLRWLALRVEQLAPSLPLVVHAHRQISLADLAAARAQRLAGQSAAATAGAVAHAVPPEPVLTLEIAWRDVMGGGREAARTRRAQVIRAGDALGQLERAVAQRLGEDAPSFNGPRRALDKVLDELTRLERECHFLAGPIGEAQPPGDDLLASPTPMAPAHVGAAARGDGRIENRAQAVEQLRGVAAFFRSNEPHSPVAYLADKAVRWSDMPLHEWLRAVVKDGGSLSHLEEMLGVDAPGGP